jgi:hypothetical protein
MMYPLPGVGDNWWRVVMAVLPLCAMYGGSITSWYRTPTRNRMKGGVDNSKHLTGEAVDVAWDGPYPPLDALKRHCAAYGVQVVREPSHGHDHFEYDPEAARAVA